MYMVDMDVGIVISPAGVLQLPFLFFDVTIFGWSVDAKL